VCGKMAKMKKTDKFDLNIWIAVVVLALIAITGILVLFSKRTSSSEIEKSIERYVNLYIGLINISVERIEKIDGGYKAIVNATSYSGPVVLELYLYDNLSVYKIAQIIQPPEKPKTIIEIPYKVSCSKERTAIDIYIDPYDQWSRKYDSLIQDFLDKHNVSEVWRIVRTESYSFNGKDAENAFLLLKYFECEKGEKNFKSFRKCVYEKIDKKGGVLNESEIKECLSDGVPNECLKDGAVQQLKIDESFALTYLQSPSTPMIVIDCKYKTWPTFIENVYSYLYNC
jgi:hypothetical protein